MRSWKKDRRKPRQVAHVGVAQTRCFGLTRSQVQIAIWASLIANIFLCVLQSTSIRLFPDEIR